MPPGDQPPTGEQSDSPDEQQNGMPAGQQGGAGDQQTPDLAAAAAQLGVSEEALRAAMGDSSQVPPDFAAAAETLGVTEEDLMDALGVPEGGPPQGGQRPTN